MYKKLIVTACLFVAVAVVAVPGKSTLLAPDAGWATPWVKPRVQRLKTPASSPRVKAPPTTPTGAYSSTDISAESDMSDMYAKQAKHRQYADPLPTSGIGKHTRIRPGYPQKSHYTKDAGGWSDVKPRNKQVSQLREAAKSVVTGDEGRVSPSSPSLRRLKHGDVAAARRKMNEEKDLDHKMRKAAQADARSPKWVAEDYFSSSDDD